MWGGGGGIWLAVIGDTLKPQSADADPAKFSEHHATQDVASRSF